MSTKTIETAPFRIADQHWVCDESAGGVRGVWPLGNDWEPICKVPVQPHADLIAKAIECLPDFVRVAEMLVQAMADPSQAMRWGKLVDAKSVAMLALVEMQRMPKPTDVKHSLKGFRDELANGWNRIGGGL